MCSSFLRQFLLALSQGQVWVPLGTVWSPFRSVTPSAAVGGGPQEFSYNILVKAVRCFEKHLGFIGPWISYFIIFKTKQWMIMNLILLKLPVTGTRRIEILLTISGASQKVLFWRAYSREKSSWSDARPGNPGLGQLKGCEQYSRVNVRTWWLSSGVLHTPGAYYMIF